MRILVAEDSRSFSQPLMRLLNSWQHEPVLAEDGETAWEILQDPESPRVALLDWIMPGVEGPEICRRARRLPGGDALYLVLLTSRDSRDDVVKGLEMGANDYVIKPFNAAELRARVNVGVNVAQLQLSLSRRVAELENALAQLQGLLPICSYCKKVRNDSNYWEQVETYVTRCVDAKFTHTICPTCYDDVIAEMKTELPQ